MEIGTKPNAAMFSFLSETQRRIATIEDFHCYLNHKFKLDNLEYIYSNPYIEKEKNIVKCRPYDHTMFDAIDEYCIQKFPSKQLRHALKNDYIFEVHGVFPQHFKKEYRIFGFQKITPINFISNPTSKIINYMRPEFFFAENKIGNKYFIIAVGCGHDYVLHYAGMLNHILDTLTRKPKIKIIRYPHAESSLPLWTELSNNFIHKNDLVITGYIDSIKQEIEQDTKNFIKISKTENEYYVSFRFKNLKNGIFINLLGVKYSFWGDISAKIVTQICILGATEILYLGKLGELIKPEFIYKKIFCPSKYTILYHDKIISWVDDLQNNFLRHYPRLDSGLHASVPTILEEDYIQRKVTETLQINTIDNEISQMAFAIKRFNNLFHSNISFSGIHFATDYIRKGDEKELNVNFNLSNNRDKEALKKKKEMMLRITKIISSYLKERV